MDIQKSTLIHVSREAVLTYLLSPNYDEALVEGIEAIASITEHTRTQDEHTLTRVMRYGAETASRMPSFLSKYKDKAPEFVYWDQIEIWNLSDFSLSYTIKADIKPEWQKYYTTRGTLQLTQSATDQTKLVATLHYKVNVFGLSRLIEKALLEEVSTILTTQGALTAQHFE